MKTKYLKLGKGRRKVDFAYGNSLRDFLSIEKPEASCII